MNWKITIFVTLCCFMVGAPAYAYGDPSGGALFQVLMPTLAAIWATWMIFANHVSRITKKALAKLMGSSRDTETSNMSASTEKDDDELSSPLA